MSRSFLDTRDGRAHFRDRSAASVGDANNVLLVDRDRLLGNNYRLAYEMVSIERHRLAQRLRSLANRRREKRKSPEPTIPA